MPQTGNLLKSLIRFSEPDKYLVYIYNDDFTPMDLVVMILQTVFYKPLEEATGLMLEVHHGTKARVGEYSYDVAKTKAGKAIKIARENGYPLKVTVEKK